MCGFPFGFVVPAGILFLFYWHMSKYIFKRHFNTHVLVTGELGTALGPHRQTFWGGGKYAYFSFDSRIGGQSQNTLNGEGRMKLFKITTPTCTIENRKGVSIFWIIDVPLEFCWWGCIHIFPLI